MIDPIPEKVGYRGELWQELQEVPLAWAQAAAHEEIVAKINELVDEVNALRQLVTPLDP